VSACACVSVPGRYVGPSALLRSRTLKEKATHPWDTWYSHGACAGMYVLCATRSLLRFACLIYTSENTHTCVRVSVPVCCYYTYIYIYICVCVCARARAGVCMYVYIYIYIYNIYICKLSMAPFESSLECLRGYALSATLTAANSHSPARTQLNSLAKSH